MDTPDNQPPLLAGYNAFTADRWLGAVVARLGLECIAREANLLGEFVGSESGQQLAELANRFTPELKTHDRFGKRIDTVDYHPAYHELMSRAIGAGVHSLAWTAKTNGFSSRAVLFYLWNQLENGTACPVTMTFASIPVLRRAPEIAREWEAKILANAYDPRPLPMARKPGVTIGMALTEKQGGSDLRTVQSTATPASGDEYLLEGHKWFCSAPMSDAFFTLARLPEGVTCFFLPRTLDDGTRNPLRIQRLKDKCGNRSNASSEIEFAQTRVRLVGEPGRGIATLIEMAHHTRFDIVVGCAGMMRAVLNQALHHAKHREAFGKRVADHALMQNVLADMALETEAATLIAFRLSQAFDASAVDTRERAVQRILTPIAKFWLCKRLPAITAEAMECLGGGGYVEEAPLARFFRESPLNGIWEGSGNVVCLDVLRSMQKSPESVAALLEEIAAAAAGDPMLARQLQEIRALLAQPDDAEVQARRIVESIALAAQAALMLRHADRQSADAFVASRLGDRLRGFGTLARGVNCAALIERAAT
jgi:putative acyl-CoA dehydrogenase